MIYPVLLVVFGLLLVLLIAIDYRDTWNPPMKGRGTPKILNHKKSAPYNTQGRPTILNPKWASPHVEEEIEEFNEFVSDIRGSINTTKGKVPIRHCSGVLTHWSYKPFREGHWRDFITSGLTNPKILHWFGKESMVPNPKNNMIESPLTLVTSEEDILRILNGSVKVRIFTSYQPTFPKFTIDEHGDSLVGPFNHKIKGEEFIATDGMILAIPRGWAYRLQLDENCKGVIRIPVQNPLSWSSNLIHYMRSAFSSNTRPKHNKAYNTYGSNRPIEDTYSEGGSVSSTDSES